MTVKELLSTTEDKMNKTLTVLDRDYKSIRAGRANVSVLDRITVDYYGAPTPIQQMAAVSVPEPRILMIQPWDASTLKDIERAILVSDIGINPQNDGRVIRLSFPPLTEERRKEICKEVRKKGEDGKVALRNLRREAIDKLKTMKKSGDITEDDEADCEKKIQTLTDRFVKEIDNAAADKEKEIMEL
ncbi:MAG: ribosome recycling factor [Clostridia bacterium]|nr:ribosome recycling factor [Clostridia bacterium]